MTILDKILNRKRIPSIYFVRIEDICLLDGEVAEEKEVYDKISGYTSVSAKYEVAKHEYEIPQRLKGTWITLIPEKRDDMILYFIEQQTGIRVRTIGGLVKGQKDNQIRVMDHIQRMYYKERNAESIDAVEEYINKLTSNDGRLLFVDADQIRPLEKMTIREKEMLLDQKSDENRQAYLADYLNDLATKQKIIGCKYQKEPAKRLIKRGNH